MNCGAVRDGYLITSVASVPYKIEMLPRRGWSHYCHLSIQIVIVLLLVLVLGCCGQDAADDGPPRLVFPDPGIYASATECEWYIDSDWDYGYEIFSWYYPDPYPPHTQCLFFFEAAQDEIVEIFFEPLFEIEHSKECVYDYLEIRDGRFGFSPLIGRICGDKAPGNITSSGRYLWMLFVSDEDLQFEGFSAQYRFKAAPAAALALAAARPEECFFSLSGSYDGEFSIKQATTKIRRLDEHTPIDCVWQIDQPEVSKIMIEFTTFEMNDKNKCRRNRVIIYDKYSAADWMIREYCSTTAPAAMTRSNRMFVRFVASNISAYNEVKMRYTAYTDRPCDEELSFPCGPYMCLNRTLVCNGRRNCLNYGFDEEPQYCNADKKAGFFGDRVDIALIITMTIIFTVTCITIVVTCRHSCLRTREKAKTMANRRRLLDQQVQIMMDKENAVESHEMNSLGDKYSTQYGQYTALGRNSSSGAGATRPSVCSHDFPLTSSQLKEYERLMDSEMNNDLGQVANKSAGKQRTQYPDADSPWVRANQYNESFRKSSAHPFKQTSTDIHAPF